MSISSNLRRMDGYGLPSAAVGSRLTDSRGAASAPLSSATWPSAEDPRRLVLDPSSSSHMNSLPPTVDQPPSKDTVRVLSDNSANADGLEDAWAELKVCHA